RMTGYGRRTVRVAGRRIETIPDTMDPVPVARDFRLPSPVQRMQERRPAIRTAFPVLVARRGFEPLISALRGRCPRPLDERATTGRILLQASPIVNSLATGTRR